MSVFSEQEKLIDTYDEYTLFLKIQELTMVRNINMYNTKNDKKPFNSEDLNNYINKCIMATSKFGVIFLEDGSSPNYVEWYDRWNKHALSKNEGFCLKYRNRFTN